MDIIRLSEVVEGVLSGKSGLSRVGEHGAGFN